MNMFGKLLLYIGRIQQLQAAQFLYMLKFHKLMLRFIHTIVHAYPLSADQLQHNMIILAV